MILYVPNKLVILFLLLSVIGLKGSCERFLQGDRDADVPQRTGVGAAIRARETAGRAAVPVPQLRDRAVHRVPGAPARHQARRQHFALHIQGEHFPIAAPFSRTVEIPALFHNVSL